jgi:hypothetical protein
MASHAIGEDELYSEQMKLGYDPLPLRRAPETEERPDAAEGTHSPDHWLEDRCLPLSAT